MSRQQGRRDRPRRRRRPAEVTEAGRRAGTTFHEPITRGRKWAAVGAGTFVAVFAFTAIATAIVEAGDGNDSRAVTAVGVAVILTPVAFMVSGFVSRNARWLRAAAIGGPLAIVIFVGLGLVLREPLTPAVAGLGVGAALSLRYDDGLHSMKWRLGAAVIVAAYIALLWRIAPGLATVLTPFLPFPAVAVADSVTEKRAEDGVGGSDREADRDSR